MIITNMLVTPTGVVIIDYINDKKQEDTIYIHEQRLLKALEKVSSDDGLVMRAGAKRSIKTIKVIG